MDSHDRTCPGPGQGPGAASAGALFQKENERAIELVESLSPWGQRVAQAHPEERFESAFRKVMVDFLEIVCLWHPLSYAVNTRVIEIRVEMEARAGVSLPALRFFPPARDATADREMGLTMSNRVSKDGIDNMRSDAEFFLNDLSSAVLLLMHAWCILDVRNLVPSAFLDSGMDMLANVMEQADDTSAMSSATNLKKILTVLQMTDSSDDISSSSRQKLRKTCSEKKLLKRESKKLSRSKK